ncbi:MAG: hypothetical protein ACR2LM_06925 [Pyrinomonadaceae bacterium]
MGVISVGIVATASVSNMSQALPHELTSLIHHVHLNEAGWWERGIRQLIVSIVWLSGSLLPEAISRILKEQYAIKLSSAAIDEHLRILTSAGTLVVMPTYALKIGESELKQLQIRLKEAEAEDIEVKRIFEHLLKTHCPELVFENTWNAFNENLLLPLIREMGAKTFELISGTRHRIEETATFSSFLEKFSSDIQDSMRITVVEFLNPQHLPVRSYVLKNLNTYFFLEAGNMSQEAIEALRKITETGHVLKLFLDTNIIFSILGFHNNPSNEAVQSLLRVVKQLSEKVGIQFYVLPITVGETKRSLDLKKLDLASVKLSTNIASVAAELEELSGASRKFAEASLKAGRALTTEEYFGPFLNNLLAILRAHNVELYNDPRLGSYSTRQDIVDDILLTENFEQRKYGNRAKGYDKIEHDIILWHFVGDLRRTPLEAPFEAEQWIVTIDYRLLGFDEYKQGQGTFRMPVCLHPSGLVQMLQFWVPRSAEFEKALITGFQLPFLFREFDLDAEKVTIKILQTMARYEDIESVPRETIGNIILNQALRERIKVEKDESKQIQLVKDAFVEVNLKLSLELSVSENQRQAIEREKDAISLAAGDKLGALETSLKDLQLELRAQKQRADIQEGKFANFETIQKSRALSNASIMINLGTILPVLLVAAAVYNLLEPVFDNWGWIEPFAWLLSIGLYVALLLLGIKLEPWRWRSRLKDKIAKRLLGKYLSPLYQSDLNHPRISPSDPEDSQSE